MDDNIKKFRELSIDRIENKYENSIQRESPIYQRENELRSQFQRDYNRILHSNAYRRLKHKTQVFFATKNDHICTRIEHVNHVSAISYTLSSFLGLNTELTTAIALGHDIGHAPFGHEGEYILNSISERELKSPFWHERNSLYFADNIEVLQNPQGIYNNLNLTYGVRDGIICHCGERDDRQLIPRNEVLKLDLIDKNSRPMPYTWEACIVRIADKIAYLGRDIEDAILLNMIKKSEIDSLIVELKKVFTSIRIEELNNTNIIHNFMSDLCNNSNPQDGIKFSDSYFGLICYLRTFNNENIYMNPRLDTFKKYARLVIESIYELLSSINYSNDVEKLRISLSQLSKYYRELINHFKKWLIKYSNYYKNRDSIYNEMKIIYDLKKTEDYKRAIVDFIAGMTDSFAIKLFDEIISF